MTESAPHRAPRAVRVQAAVRATTLGHELSAWRDTRHDSHAQCLRCWHIVIVDAHGASGYALVVRCGTPPTLCDGFGD